MYILAKLINGNKMRTFSALSRKAYLELLESQTFDLLVVGGGITGAGIALDAAARGLKVALVEKKDFAWGTSSRSTKLIHGGLRYLKQFEVGLVREVGQERAIVYQNARHVVRPEKMLLPIVQGGSLGRFMSSLGLWVYDYLAKVDKTERRKMLSASQTAQAEPLLRKDILKGGGMYYEYRTDDARLTIENIKTAHSLGAICLNYAEVQDFLVENGQVQGARLKDHIYGKDLVVRARMVLNAAGPWVDELRRMNREAISGKRLKLTKGVHIVVPRERLPLQQAAYFDVEADNRMVFAVPRSGVTYIGTTDTFYEKDTNNPVATREDVDYILAAANAMFPQQNLELADVVSTWAGLRPLIHEDGKDPSELSRKDEIFTADNGLVSIAGGKLTGYRKMAERALDVVVGKLRQQYPDDYGGIKACRTDKLPLNGSFASEEEMRKFIAGRSGEVKQIMLSQKEVETLVLKYGKDADLIIEKAFALYPHNPDPRRRLHEAELWYSIQHEMSHNLCDYLVRRTGRLYFERTELLQDYIYLADKMAAMLAWDEATKQEKIAELERELGEVMAFKGQGQDSTKVSVA